MNTRRLTTLAMLMAIYVVLSILTPVRILNFKFTFEAFPILVAGLLMGPIDGLLVGTVGSFIYQLLFSGYGITLTTPLWILPHAISGFIVGSYAKKNDFELGIRKLILICVISAFTVTFLNTVALYIDSRLYGYYSKTLVFGNIFVKIAVGIILSIIYSSVMPKLLQYLKKKIEQ